MIKTTEELLQAIREHIGEDTSDESISFLEDVTDTISDLESKSKDGTNWEQKFKENDEAWRKKYRDRFFSSEGSDDEDGGDSSPKGLVNFTDLFKEE